MWPLFLPILDVVPKVILHNITMLLDNSVTTFLCEIIDGFDSHIQQILMKFIIKHTNIVGAMTIIRQCQFTSFLKNELFHHLIPLLGLFIFLILPE